LPHIDRYDFIFVFKPLNDEQEKVEYAKKKFEIFRSYHNNKNNGNSKKEEVVAAENGDDDDSNNKEDHDYSFLRKIIKHAKSFSPELSEDAEAMIMQCWAGLSSNVFPTNCYVHY
jgi:DNA replicative helicase MCM subunit Mcm2 (Cdc46/Mcm family)